MLCEDQGGDGVGKRKCRRICWAAGRVQQWVTGGMEGLANSRDTERAGHRDAGRAEAGGLENHGALYKRGDPECGVRVRSSVWVPCT